ncbi:L-lactate dehydrogenase (cytochrome) [Marinobacterium halophilum]|uniref:L-lactate dehydrogenase (Cytochrome) n=1 Tax=Marinobacterium halophilum TaxID=267374 RepID=A0A2P8ERZ9_9GAMM|nr:alpha-hydroxy acid oxidase [Marinobacterium halophilum]PSL12223.1 L-lactate dehydrogenase (cytochrome) [Marinobacterium halophilum]
MFTTFDLLGVKMSNNILMSRYPSSAYLQSRARKRLPGFVYDYLEGGSGRQAALARNTQVFDQVDLIPRYFNDCAAIDLQTELFGQTFEVPFGVAPIGMDGLVYPHAVSHLAQSAQRYGCPIAASTFSTTSLEEVVRLAGDNAWFQLYPFSDERIESDILDRARNAGYSVLIVTVDVPTGGRRERDMRNGLSLPPRPNLRMCADLVQHPGWALRLLQSGVPSFSNLHPYKQQSNDFLPAKVEGAVSWLRLEAFRRRWPGTLVVKGVLHPEDAQRCQALGVDGIVVSNHGGRQLDACPSTIEVLPAIRAAVGESFPVLVDSGLRSGLDVARALAAGADFALLGRTFMYGMAALGGAGADHSMQMLRDELENTLQMIRCPNIAQLKQWQSHNMTPMQRKNHNG